MISPKTYSGLLGGMCYFFSPLYQWNTFSFKIFGHTGPFWGVRIHLVAKNAAHDGIFTRRWNRFERFQTVALSKFRRRKVKRRCYATFSRRNFLYHGNLRGPPPQCHLTRGFFYGTMMGFISLWRFPWQTNIQPWLSFINGGTENGHWWISHTWKTSCC